MPKIYKWVKKVKIDDLSFFFNRQKDYFGFFGRSNDQKPEIFSCNTKIKKSNRQPRESEISLCLHHYTKLKHKLACATDSSSFSFRIRDQNTLTDASSLVYFLLSWKCALVQYNSYPLQHRDATYSTCKSLPIKSKLKICGKKTVCFQFLWLLQFLFSVHEKNMKLEIAFLRSRKESKKTIIVKRETPDQIIPFEAKCHREHLFSYICIWFLACASSLLFDLNALNITLFTHHHTNRPKLVCFFLLFYSKQIQ